MPYGQSGATDRVCVLVADNSPIHTQLLAEALKRDRALEVTTADSGVEGLLAAVSKRNVDVVVISSNLDEQVNKGFDVLRQLRAANRNLRSVVLLDSSKEEIVLEAFRAGARGIFGRHGSLDALSKCIHCVHQGQIWGNSEEMSLVLEALASAPSVRAVDANGMDLLSKREKEVVQCLAEGLSNREIAEKLNLSQHTVKNYLFRVFDKLGVSSRIELLFMTLSQNNSSRGQLDNLLQCPVDQVAITRCTQAAEEGQATAQLALAELYGSRKTAGDLPEAYMWYLIADEQISRARKNIGRLMTPEQVLEAEQKAALRLGKTKKRALSGMEPAATSRPAVATGD